MNEKNGLVISGWLILLLFIPLGVFLVYSLSQNVADNLNTARLGIIIPSLFLYLYLFNGFYTNEPNESVIQLFFGSYIGTDKKTGFRYTIPLFRKIKLSLRIQDFETELIKVNDLNGNPIELSAIVIWKIKDTYAAYFEIEDYNNYIRKQSIAALRTLAMKYPYEATNTYTESLITHTEEVSESLIMQIQEKVQLSGLEIVEARINHLSYAKEIAAAMLQRQQASAIISAKTEIVEGAVGMVEMAINNLESKEIVTFNSEDKRKLVSNLLVVLCSDQGTQPIIETST